MKKTVQLSWLLACLLPMLVLAQPGKQVRIINSEGVFAYNPLDYDNDRFDLKDSLEASLSSFGARNVLNNALRDAWPDGLKGDNWNTNQYKLGQYNAYVEAYFKHYTVVNINYNMNQHLEPSLRPKTRDFFMIVENSSLSYNLKATMTGQPAPVSSKPPAKGSGSAATEGKVDKNKLNAAVVFQKCGRTPVIIQQDLEYFPSYEASRNEVLQKWLTSTFSPVQAERMAARIKRTNWPKGTMLDENDDKYHLYKAYLVYEFRGVPYNGNDDGDELALIFIPRNENQANMPANMRPETEEGMFMVYRRNALEYEGNTIALKTWTEMNGGPASNNITASKPAAKPASWLGPDFTKAVQAYPKSFADIKGAALYTDVFGNKKWESKLKMNKADSVRITLSQLKGITLDIYFPSFANSSSASQLYNLLLSEILAASLPCGPLKELSTENDEKTGLRYHSLVPANVSPLYKGLEIMLRQRPSFGKVNGSFTNVYAIGVEIRGKK